MRRFVEGKTILNPHPVIRTFAMCASMQWNHLPVAGGLNDQHPELLEMFQYIFGEQGRHEERDRKKKEAEAKRNARSGSRRGRRR